MLKKWQKVILIWNGMRVIKSWQTGWTPTVVRIIWWNVIISHGKCILFLQYLIILIMYIKKLKCGNFLWGRKKLLKRAQNKSLLLLWQMSHAEETSLYSVRWRLWLVIARYQVTTSSAVNPAVSEVALLLLFFTKLLRQKRNFASVQPPNFWRHSQPL